MDNRSKASWWRQHRPTTRRLVQLYSALLHNACLKGCIDGNIYRGSAKYVCVPGLNCYSCPAAVGACPLGALQNALGSSGHGAGWYALGILLLFGVLLGRTVCGWLCPFGLIQDLLNRIPTPKTKKSRVTRALTWVKYALLAALVVAAPLWFGLRHDLQLPAFCKYVCPAGTLEGAIGHLANPTNADMYGMLGALFTQKFIIMVAIAAACVFCRRAFCRFLCPLGAIYGLFNRFSVVGVKIDADLCNGCGACVRSCGMDVRRVGDRECIQCAGCMEACSRGAISLKAGAITLKSPAACRAGDANKAPEARKSRGGALWAVALILLFIALIWFNALDPSLRNSTPDIALPASASDGEATVGHEVGQYLEDFTLTCYDGNEFRLSEQRGKVTFINLWATTCAPCKQELPHFDALYREHGDDIAMIVVHTPMVTDDPAAYISGKGYAMPCATDTDGWVLAIVGGTGVFPQTIVLNRDGEVVYNRPGSATPELLKALYDEADRSTADESPATAAVAPSSPAAGKLPFSDGFGLNPSAGEYRVIVLDRGGNPVEGAAVQFCDESSCAYQSTGADGVAAFQPDAAKAYEVHILSAPEGYAVPEESYRTKETWSDLTIILEAEE